MSEVCPNVATEPTLQPVSNEHFSHRSANIECAAHLDVKAQGFWGIHHQQAYFDVRVFNPLYWLLQITRLTFLLASDLMIMRSVGCMNSESMKLSVDHLPPLFFQL